MDSTISEKLGRMTFDVQELIYELDWRNARHRAILNLLDCAQVNLGKAAYLAEREGL